MILFAVEGRALGIPILKGENLSFKNVLRSLTLISDYEDIYPVEVKIKSGNEKTSTEGKMCHVVPFDDFINNRRRLRPFALYTIGLNYLVDDPKEIETFLKEKQRTLKNKGAY